MKRNFKNFLILSILTLTLAIFFTGCNSSEKKSTKDDISNTKKGLDVDQPNDLTGDRNINKGNDTTPSPMDDENLNLTDVDPKAIDDQDIDSSSMMKRSKDLAIKLSELDKVNNANVLITGHTALVGIDIPKDSNDESTKQIKNTVENKVKELDKQIERVVVTADADLITRMKNLGNDIESGKPISGLGQQIEEIVKRVTPNM